jgi:hypothetical protein
MHCMYQTKVIITAETVVIGRHGINMYTELKITKRGVTKNVSMKRKHKINKVNLY